MSPFCRGLCNCARKNKPRPDLKEIQVQYHNALSDLAWDYNGEDNFTVVLQPFLLDQDFPRDVRIFIILLQKHYFITEESLLLYYRSITLLQKNLY